MKLRKKLLLSCAALAACATTMVSTTYAWFVSNSEASVSGISGATASGSAAGNFLVANGNASTTIGERAYSSQITIGADYITDNTLSPATKATGTSYFITSDTSKQAGKTYYTKSGDAYTEFAGASFAQDTPYYEQVTQGQWVDKYGVLLSSQTPYIEFTFWVLSTGTQTSFTLEYDVVNTTALASARTQTSYNSNGMPTGIGEGDTFEVNAVNAMRMEILKQVETTSEGVASLGDIGTVQTVQLDAAGNSTSQYITFADDRGDANKYYYNLLNEIPYGCTTDGSPLATTTGAARLSDISIAQNQHTLLTFRIWLEGTDAGCFDSTLNQSFSLAFRMSV